MKKTVSQKDVETYRVKHLLPEGARLTRYKATTPITIGDASFEFDYRRDGFDFFLDDKKLKFIGIPKLESKTHHKVFLTNSGQAAINACYFYADKVLKIKEIESHNDYLYVGAYRLQSVYGIKHTRNPSNCLWVCSTSTKFENIMQLSGSWDVVIVDTTCWGVGSRELQQVYEKFKSNPLVIFFRSHSKLDMGGVEYGSLGNLSLFSNDEALLQKSADYFKEVFGLNGGNAILDEIPPYLFSEEFYHQSIDRVQTIVDNTRFIEQEIEEGLGRKIKYGEFIFPDHYKYFFVRLKLATTDQIIDRLHKKLHFLLSLNLPQARSCASFGFNFPSVTFYKSDEGIGHFFRFSTGTINSEENDKLLLCINEAFSS
tara:strand:+ start:1095 stop:2207 length:1113 start_codon:yes stop_codon:yes gene_type:complete